MRWSLWEANLSGSLWGGHERKEPATIEIAYVSESSAVCCREGVESGEVGDVTVATLPGSVPETGGLWRILGEGAKSRR